MSAAPVKKASLKEEQAALLGAIRKRVEVEAFEMKRAVDRENLKDTLKHASAMLHELRTGQLTPKNYYELYMQVFDHLLFLELFFTQVHRNGTPMPELYQMVQHAGNVLTRMYLLITVGSVFIKSRKAPAKDILNDLVEMAKGVQHPTRGLFLRYYLCQKTKDKLPDLHSEYEGFGGTVNDAIEFALQNFAEMVSLWVRMQNQRFVRNRKTRERQRQDLRVIVGTNLVLLSQMEGVDQATFSKKVLPNLLEQVVNSKDKIAQYYLMDSIIQVFPAEYHIRSLDPFLEACMQLMPEVDRKSLAVTLMTRIADFARRGPADGGSAEPIPASIPAFRTFRAFCDKLTSDTAAMPPTEVLELYQGLLDFTTQCYPDVLGNVDEVLKSAVTAVASMGPGPIATGSDSAKIVVSLLQLPQEKLGLQVLQLDNYAELMKALAFGERRSTARSLLQSVLSLKSQISSAAMMSKLLTFITPLLKDEEGAPSEEADIIEDFEEEQRNVARLLHAVKVDTTEQEHKILEVVREAFGYGGTRRIPYTLPALVFAALRLVDRMFAAEAAGESSQPGVRKMLQFVHEICTALASSHPNLALRLFLQCALVADRAKFSYEFFSQALVLTELLDTDPQVRATQLIVASLYSTKNLDEGNYETLSTRITQQSAKLVRKIDQCRMVCACAKLFWKGAEDAPDGFRKPQQVLACLKRALMLTDECMPLPVDVFVEILDQCLYFFEKRCPTITDKFLNGLLALIREHIRSMTTDKSRVQAHFDNAFRHIRRVKQSKHGEIYSSIEA